MACFPSTSTSLTSSTFFFLPRVPTLFQMVSPEFPFLGVEVAAGEFALLGLGECITELFPLDLESDISKPFFQKKLVKCQESKAQKVIFVLQGHPKMGQV